MNRTAIPDDPQPENVVDGQPRHLAFYEREDIVRKYADRDELHKAEETILERLRPRLGTMRMLDIGVGGGRTTIHFAPLVMEYTGIDFSPSMVAACQERFADAPFETSWKVCDVTNMDMFDDDSFDLIFFSFCGLDGLCWDDRLRALREIRRVGRPGGMLCFSSHNLQGLERAFRIPLTPHPVRLLRNCFEKVQLRLRNESIRKLKQLQYVMLIEQVKPVRAGHYYIKPTAQIRQLIDESFENVQVFDRVHGREIVGPAQLDTLDDWYAYYLCAIG